MCMDIRATDNTETKSIYQYMACLYKYTITSFKIHDDNGNVAYKVSRCSALHLNQK